MNVPATEKAKRIVKEGVFIGSVSGVPFYEHPTYGDECPLLYITKDGRVKLSDFYELPDYTELPVDAVC